jgi:hypothetical protein
MQRIFIKKYPVCGGKCTSRKAFNNWVEKFSHGRSKVANDVRPGRPVEITTEASVQRAEEFVQADRRITTDIVTTALGCSHCLAYSIMNEHWKFRIVRARWMPRELKDREKMNRINLSLQHLLRYADEGDDMLAGLLLGTNHECITTNTNQSVL